MTFTKLALRSLVHYRRTHIAVALGVAAAVAVLAGSLLVGSSVRGSLRSMAESRLGRTAIVVGTTQPFPATLADRMTTALGSPVAPLFTLNGIVTHESSSKRAGSVNVYGVDARFFAFHGVSATAPEGSQALLSPDLAAELGAVAEDAVLVRIARPTDIPIDSLYGKREDAGRSIRLTMKATLAADQMGEFRLAPGQGPSRAIFVPLARVQRDLGMDGRANTLLVSSDRSAAQVNDALTAKADAADLGIKIEALADNETVVVESISGLIPDRVADAVVAVADRERLSATPVLTWLATGMKIGDRSVPYSLVSALGRGGSGDAQIAGAVGAVTAPPPIVLNAWAARDLGAKEGDVVLMEFLRWADEGRLVSETARFRVTGIVAMRGLAVDRRMAPDYPGITTATDVSDWDPPFPIDLKRVRKIDEDYWDEYKTAPKAFISLEVGQKLWQTRHGRLTSIRLRADARSATNIAEALRTAVPAAVTPQAAGFNVVDVRAQSLAASVGATDFGLYFSYFSFFLMVAALLLSALFFRLSTEQRLPQIGVLRAGGLAATDIRKLLVIEGALVAGAGGVLGIALAIGWAAAMMFALRTWWVGAVGTTRLALHIDALTLAAGTVGAIVASLVAVVLTVRAISRMTPRAQLTGAGPGTLAPSHPRTFAPSHPRTLALLSFVLALALSILSALTIVPPAGGFFGAGALMLVAGLAGFRSWVARTGTNAFSLGALGPWSLEALAIRNVAWRPGRSLTVAGLVAAAVFLLVAVESFRKSPGAPTSRDSGTGGFALMAESAVPIAHDLQSAEGREAAGLGKDLTGVSIFNLRLRPGDDTSCLNLYQPKQPRIVGVPDRLIREGRFAFAGLIATTEAESKNPWTLLGPPEADGTIPAIADNTSLQYVLHAAVGDVIEVDKESSRPLKLRIVAALADSVLQGEIMIGEAAFETVFPGISGYRAFLVSVDPATPERIDTVTRALEEQLSDSGFDAETTAAKLEAFHRVENTYLSAFQALGGLGIVLGCVGVVAIVLRNVLERRRELALLGAAGFTGGQLQRMVAFEHATVIGAGLVVGVAAAAIAVAPVLLSRGDGPPWHALVWLLPVGICGLAAAIGATRMLRKLPLVPSLRSE